MSVTDEELTAYLDGALDGADKDRIARALAEDAALSGRLDALRLPMGAVADALRLDAIGAPAAPAVLTREPSARVDLRLIAASLLACAIGAGMSLAVLRAPEPDWMDSVAAYQALYVPETLAAVRQPAAEAAKVLGQFGADHSLDLTSLTDLGALEFRRAQRLAIDGAPLLQMAYVTPDGTPVAFCITAVKDGDRDLRLATLAGLQAAHWTQDGNGFILIGDIDAETTRTVAERIATTLRSAI